MQTFLSIFFFLSFSILMFCLYKYFRKFGIRTKHNGEKRSIKELKELKLKNPSKNEFDELLYEKLQKRFLLILIIICASIFVICLITYSAIYL
ncbi:hypothetical protein [Spiroplasma sp. DGKH1]|uniref:hypothetical protein n=1 Tax=Spiroplasma sp. DGKH1 TaxID=3050074 RepID=UPI0034C5F8DE